MISVLPLQATCNKYFFNYNNDSSAYLVRKETLRRFLQEGKSLGVTCYMTSNNNYLNKCEF